MYNPGMHDPRLVTGVLRFDPPNPSTRYPSLVDALSHAAEHPPASADAFIVGPHGARLAFADPTRSEFVCTREGKRRVRVEVLQRGAA